MAGKEYTFVSMSLSNATDTNGVKGRCHFGPAYTILIASHAKNSEEFLNMTRNEYTFVSIRRDTHNIVKTGALSPRTGYLHPTRSDQYASELWVAPNEPCRLPLVVDT